MILQTTDLPLCVHVSSLVFCCQRAPILVHPVGTFTWVFIGGKSYMKVVKTTFLKN